MKPGMILLATMLSVMNCLPAMSAQLSPSEVDLVNYIDVNKTNQLSLLKRLVNINSGTANRLGVIETGDIIRSEFESLGFSVKWVDIPVPMKHAGSLVATYGNSANPQLLLIGHLDTVFPSGSSFQSFTFSSDKKTATGPGVIDDKGGIVTILYALKALEHTGKLKSANITVVLTGDEEHAAQPTEISRKALRDAARNSDIALGFEFGLDRKQLIVGRRGLSEWYLSSTGKVGHSSRIFSPESGFGAIYETARVLNAFRTDLSGEPGLTLNPGIILGGQTISENENDDSGRADGSKTIIAKTTLVHGDLRFLTISQRKIAEQKMNAVIANPLLHTSSQVRFNDIMPVMPETDANRHLLAQFSAINIALGGEPLQAASAAERGGADISYVAQYVSACIDGLGPWGQGAHSQQETLETDSLPVVTKRAAIFISRYIKN